MGVTTIEWTTRRLPDGTVRPGYTFNPWTVCTPVSPGCANCYASSLHKRFHGEGYKKGLARIRTSEENWKKPLMWDRKARAAHTFDFVFCASMADVFDDEAPLEWLADLCDLIRKTPSLIWQLLTKRDIHKRLEALRDYAEKERRFELENWLALWLYDAVPPGNVWLGASVENQDVAEPRVTRLLEVAAQRHFLSCEPLIAEVKLNFDWREYNQRVKDGRFKSGTYNRIDWVICGGESGTGARPIDPDWVRSLRDQCDQSKIPFFFKQWGNWLPESQAPNDELLAAMMCGVYKKHHLWWDRPGNQANQRDVSFDVGKGLASNLLDGKQHLAFPE